MLNTKHKFSILYTLAFVLLCTTVLKSTLFSSHFIFGLLHNKLGFGDKYVCVCLLHQVMRVKEYYHKYIYMYICADEYF